MALFLEADEYLAGITSGYGLRVQIQEPNQRPFPAQEGLYVPSSFETDIGLKMVCGLERRRSFTTTTTTATTTHVMTEMK